MGISLIIVSLLFLIICILIIWAMVYRQEKAKEHRIELIKMYFQRLEQLEKSKKFPPKERKVWDQTLSSLMVQWFPDECELIQKTVEDIEKIYNI